MEVKIYTTQDLAKMLNVSDATIRREVERGNLKGFKVGNESRFTQHHIDQYTQIKDLGKSEREIELENEKERLVKVIEHKDLLIKNIKDLLLQEV